MAVTLKDIARMLGISHTTVHRAVNGKPGVSEDTRRRVMEKVKQLDYAPNVIARGLVSKRTSFIGVIVPFVEAPHFPQAIQGVEDVIRDLGYDMILCTTRDMENILLERIQVLREKMVEGIIVAPGICCSKAVEKSINDLYTRGTPTVVLNVLMSNIKVPVVVSDNVLAGYIATNHLIRQGRSRILHLHGPSSDLTSRHRFNGYYNALADAHVDFDSKLVLVMEGYSRDIGYQAVSKAIEDGIDFSAVYAYCDELALGAYKALREHKLRVPKDVAIIGNDNIDAAEVNEVPISTIAYDKKKMGTLAAQVLLDEIGGIGGQTVIIQPQLIERDSSRVSIA